jgi:hypothetical protein
MITYKLFNDAGGKTISINRSDNTSLPLDPANTDYIAFKQAMTTGTNADGTAVSLQDATGTVMTSAQITTFLATLP